MALNPELGYAKVASLAYLESAFFTYWNEGEGPHVDLFWDRIYECGLPYQRRDPIRKILKRGKVRSGMEAELLADVLSDVSGARLKQAELKQLRHIMEEYERKQVDGRS